jgi:hypothetical protein
MNNEDILVKFNNIFFYNVYKYFVFNNKVYNIDKTIINETNNNDDIEICKKYESYNSFLNDNNNFDIIIYKNINNNLINFNESQIINYYLFIGKKNNNITSYYQLFEDKNFNTKNNNLSNNFLLYCNNKFIKNNKINLDNFNFSSYNIKKTSVIYKFDNNRGYGDFIRGLLTSFLLSILTNKNLYIDTSSNFKKILSLPLVENNIIINGFNLDLFDYSYHKTKNNIHQNINIIENEDLIKYFGNKNIIVKSNTCILSILKNNNNYNINTLIEFMKNFYINFFNLFPLNIKNNNEKEDIKNNHPLFKEEYIGIHIRCGDKFLVNNVKNYKFKNDTRIKDFNEIETQLLKLKYFYPNQKFLICSDNNNIYDLGRKIFNDNLYTLTANNIENIHSNFIDDSKIHLLEHMILEHYYLTKSKYIIGTFSQFSMTASLIGNIPLFSINDYLYKDYNTLLQLNL